MVTVIGIDPGAKGAVAELVDGKLTRLSDLPHGGKAGVRAQELYDLLFGADLAVLERVHATPKEGAVGAFSFGGTFHACRVIADLATGELVLCSPQKWKASILGPYRGATKEEQKASAVSKFLESNDSSWLMKPRARKPSSDRAEAWCIALWGWEYCCTCGRPAYT